MAFGTGRERARGGRARGGEGGAVTVDFQEPVIEGITEETVSHDETPVEHIENTEGQTIDVGPVNVEETPVTDVIEQTETPVEQTEVPAKSADGKKRAPRLPINVGEVVVRPSSRTDFNIRNTPTETNPVFLAVKNAELGVATDILVQNDDKRISGAIALMRRSAGKNKVGLHIAAKPYPVEEIDGVEYAVLTFKTDTMRQNRGKQESETTETTESDTTVVADATE